MHKLLRFTHGKVKHSLMLLAFMCCLVPDAFVQEIASIRISSNVTSSTQVELLTLQDLYIDESYVENGHISISPVTSSMAGKLLIKGQPQAIIRITFVHQPPLVNLTRKGSLMFSYDISGFSSDNQKASLPLDVLEKTLQLNDHGEYFLWIGGRAEVGDVAPGEYEGELTLEIEYPQ
ncbi:MAG TPA: hypothetical protein PKG48_07605 [Bacteroidales bacterium]|nr:hypothetical protein [Bacteroidales bacterium]HPS62113.1 hypothetical protein [Bacteroidales bacterium]